MNKSYPVSDGRTGIPVVAKKGYSTKQNSRKTSRSIRGNRNRSNDFQAGATFGSGVSGSGNGQLVIKAS